MCILLYCILQNSLFQCRPIYEMQIQLLQEYPVSYQVCYLLEILLLNFTWNYVICSQSTSHCMAFRVRIILSYIEWVTQENHSALDIFEICRLKQLYVFIIFFTLKLCKLYLWQNWLICAYCLFFSSLWLPAFHDSWSINDIAEQANFSNNCTREIINIVHLTGQGRGV